MRKMYTLIVTAGLLFGLPSLVQAQTVTPSSITTSPAISESPTPSISPTASPAGISLAGLTVNDLDQTHLPWWTRFVRLFKSKQNLSYQKDTLKLANTDLVQAVNAAQAHKTAEATKLLAEADKELNTVQAFAVTTNDTTFKDQVVAASGAHLVALQALSNSSINTDTLQQNTANAVTTLLLNDQAKGQTDQAQHHLDILTLQALKNQDENSSKTAAQLHVLDHLARTADAKDDTGQLKSLIDAKESDVLEQQGSTTDDSTVEDAVTGDQLDSQSKEHRLAALDMAISKAPDAAKAVLMRVRAKLEQKNSEDDSRQSGTSEKHDDSGKDVKKSPVPSPSPKSETKKRSNESKKSGSSVETHTQTSGNSNSSVDIKVESDNSSTEVKTSSGQSTQTPTPESHQAVTFGVTITDSSCGSDLTVTSGSEVKVNITNKGSQEWSYSISQFGSKTVKPGELDDFGFTPKSTGTYSIVCSNGKTATLTVQ